MTAGFATLAEFKQHLNITGSSTQKDAELQGFLDASVSVIEYITGPVNSRVVVETHSGTGPTIALRQLPVLSVTSVVEYLATTAHTLTLVGDQSQATTYSYTLEPETGLLTRRFSGGEADAFYRGFENITVTYVAGYAAVPPNVRLASLFQAAHMYQTSQQAGRSQSNSYAAEDGYMIGQSFGIPNRVRELLMPQQRIPGLA